MYDCRRLSVVYLQTAALTKLFISFERFHIASRYKRSVSLAFLCGCSIVTITQRSYCKVEVEEYVILWKINEQNNWNWGPKISRSIDKPLFS